MKKILSLGQDQLTSGLSRGKHNQKSGVWYSAPGMNPFVNDDDLIGTISASSAPTDITGAVVVDTPIVAISQTTGASTGTMYISGNAGHIYTVDLSGDNNPVDVRSATPITSPANGLAIFKSTLLSQAEPDASTVALWHLDGTDGTAPKLDNAEGTAARDFTEGAGNPTSYAGVVGTLTDGGYSFPAASNGFLTCGDLAAMPTGSFTIDFWYYPSGGSATERYLITKSTASGSQKTFEISWGGTANDQIKFTVSTDGSTTKTVSTNDSGAVSSPSIGTWNHIACVFTASTSLKIYINGVLSITNSTSIPATVFDSTSDFLVGSIHDAKTTASSNCSGAFDDIRLSNVARTAEEIRARYYQRGLYYWQEGQIGVWDMSGTYPTGWTDASFAGLETTPYHPTHPLFDRVYYGNKSYVGFLYDNAGTITNNDTALDIPSDYTVTCLNDDGQSLVIGATRSQGSSTIFAETKVYFWDTNQTSWQKEYTLPAPTINAIGKIGTTLYAFCGKDLYAFNYSTPPTLVRTVGDADMPQFGQSQAVDTIGEGLVWGGTSTIQSFGKLSAEAKNAFLEPYYGVSGNVSLIFTDATTDRMFVGTATPKLWRFNTATNGAQSRPFQTIFFDLKNRARIQQLEIILPSGQASGDSTTFALLTPTDQSTGVACTVLSFANQGNVDVVKLVPDRAVETQNIALKMTMTAGAPSIGRIDFWGEPVNHQ